jgi:hypothetical protein
MLYRKLALGSVLCASILMNSNVNAQVTVEKTQSGATVVTSQWGSFVNKVINDIANGKVEATSTSPFHNNKVVGNFEGNKGTVQVASTSPFHLASVCSQWTSTSFSSCITAANPLGSAQVGINTNPEFFQVTGNVKNPIAGTTTFTNSTNEFKFNNQWANINIDWNSILKGTQSSVARKHIITSKNLFKKLTTARNSAQAEKAKSQLISSLRKATNAHSRTAFKR